MDLRLDELLDAAPVGIVHFDLDGRAIYVNRCWRSMTGCEAPLPIDSETLLALTHPADRDRIARGYADSLAHERPFEALMRVTMADGSVAAIQTRTEMVRDESSAVIGLVSSLIDVSLTLADHEVADPARHRLLHEQAPVGLMLSNPDGALVEVNRTMAEMLHTTQASLVGKYPWDIFHPEDVETVMAGLTRLTAGKPALVSESVRMLRPDGSVVWVAGASTLVADDDGRPTAIQSVIFDVTARREADELLRASERRYRTTVDSLREGVLLHREGRLDAFNRSALNLLGLSPGELSDPEEAQLKLEPVDASGRPITVEKMPGVEALRRGAGAEEVIGIRSSEGRRWLSVSAQPIFEDDTLAGVVTTLTDVTEAKVAKDALIESEQRYRSLAQIVESTSDLVGTIDPATSSLVYLNQSARELFGFADSGPVDVDVRTLYTDRAVHVWESEIAVQIEMGRTWTGELDMRSADGEALHILQSVSSDVGPDGRIRQISFVGRDVTAQRLRELELAHQATHDALTGLPNRTLLLELVEHALTRTERQPGHVALLFLDLDRFKGVNDNIGHETGDALLRSVAERILSALRPSDVVARLGGDEFVVLCEEIRDEFQAVAVTQRIISAIESTPFSVGEANLSITVSVGIALSSGESSHPEGLLRDADAAMYRAKELGRARHELFDDEMRRRSARRLALADELSAGIERGEITVHYQPLVDLHTGRVEGVEALARWEHPSRGTLAPWEFIAVAEETGLIVGLGLSVLGQACAQARRWELELGGSAPKIHVNLSARQLAQSNLPRLVRGVLDQARIDPGHLCLEVTESVLMEDATTSAKVLLELKDLGVELAIDDFGTGYSSLAYLRRFPVDVLKIDRSFVDGLGPDPDDSAIVSAIVNLAHTLELASVAEGVETTEQLAGLRALGCRTAQGFLFARPQPVPEVNRYLTTVFPVTGPDAGVSRR